MGRHQRAGGNVSEQQAPHALLAGGAQKGISIFFGSEKEQREFYLPQVTKMHAEWADNTASAEHCLPLSFPTGPAHVPAKPCTLPPTLDEGVALKHWQTVFCNESSGLQARTQKTSC